MIAKTDARVSKAFDYGKSAFENNKRCIPAHDETFLQLCNGLKVGDGSAYLAKVWIAGYFGEVA